MNRRTRWLIHQWALPVACWMAGVLLMLLTMTLIGCQRRELTYGTQEGIPFRITPDWGALPSDEEKPRYIKALFFPVDGGAVVERYIDPEGEEVRVPAGDYRIIVYNWRTNAEVQTVQFRGDTYDTFEAYTTPRSATVRTRSERELHLIPPPDAQLYGWNTGTQTVTISAISPVVRTRTSAGNALAPAMQCMVHQYVMEINIKNAQYVSSLSALLTDAYGAIPLGGGSHSNERYAVEADIRSVYEYGEVTTYYCHAITLGLFDDMEKRLVINIVGSVADDKKQQEVDVTESIDKIDKGEIPPDKPVVAIPKEDPIVVEVPGGEGGGFTPPSLDDWEDNEEEIPLN